MGSALLMLLTHFFLRLFFQHPCSFYYRTPRNLWLNPTQTVQYPLRKEYTVIRNSRGALGCIPKFWGGGCMSLWAKPHVAHVRGGKSGIREALACQNKCRGGLKAWLETSGMAVSGSGFRGLVRV